MKYRITRLVVTGLVIVLGVVNAWATDGHQLIGIGAVQKGFGGAGVASGRDATWLLLNPAAVSQLDGRVDVSFEVFAPERTMTPRGPGLPALGGNPLANSSSGTSSDDSVFYIPSVSALIPHGGGVYGLGIYGVNGMGVDYPYSRTTIPQVTGERYDRRTEYASAKFVLAYARELKDGLSLGVALNGSYARFRTDMLTSRFSQTEGGWKQDESVGAGFTAGIVQDVGAVSLGASYTSRLWVEELERYDDLLIASLDVPESIQLGLAWRVIKGVELLADYKFLHWSDVRAIGTSPAQGGFGWDDQHVVKIGAEWEASDDLTLRAGYSHGNSPIDDDVVFANALFPAIVEDHLSVGFTYRIAERHDVHATYMHAFENRLTESGTGDMISMAGTGTEISLTENTYTLQYSYLF
jgi:long-chain fatty acid transport protein